MRGLETGWSGAGFSTPAAPLSMLEISPDAAAATPTGIGEQIGVWIDSGGGVEAHDVRQYQADGHAVGDGKFAGQGIGQGVGGAEHGIFDGRAG